MKSTFETATKRGIIFVDVDRLFHQIIKDVDSYRMYSDSVWILLQKRKSVINNEDYIFLLGNELTFYHNMIDETLSHLKELINSDSFELDMEKLANKIRTIRDRIEKHIENGGANKVTELIRSNYESDEDIMYMKEQQYIFQRIKYNVLVDWFKALVYSEDLLKSVKKVKGETVKEIILERLDYYTKRVLEKAEYGE